MEATIRSQLNIIKLFKMKPNFSELSRIYGIDRRTIKKYYEGYEGKPKTKKKSSKLDRYYEIIREKLKIKGITVKAVYEYLIDNKYDIGGYSNFNKYIKERNLKPIKKIKGHPRFETPPGKQAQADWKEDISMVSKNNETFVINVFNYKLGNSRYCHFEYRKSRTRQDVFESLIAAFKDTGGVPREILFDNMASVVDISGNKRSKNPKMVAFAHDFGFDIKLCKPRHAFTKGKVEASNKFIEWLLAYNYDFESEDDLIRIIKMINDKVNTSPSQATNVPPTLLFQKEKEYLQPLPHHTVVESYISTDHYIRVHKDSLITYKGSKYSVPPQYINNYVTVNNTDNTLYIYYNTNLISVHTLNTKKINYHESDYKELLSVTIKDKDNIDSIAMENLKQLDSLL